MRVEFVREKTVIAFHIEPEVLREIDSLVMAGRFKNRSEFIITAIRELIEKTKARGLGTNDVLDILYRDLARNQTDGAFIFDSGMIKAVLNDRGLRYEAHALGRLVNRFKAYLVRKGWRYMGSYVVRGTKYHVFVRDKVPPRARDIIHEYEVREKVHRFRRYYKHLAREVVDYVLKNPGRFIVNPSGLFKLNTRDIVEVAQALGISNVRVSAWLVQKLLQEFRERGFTAWKERHSRYTYIYFRKAT